MVSGKIFSSTHRLGWASNEKYIQYSCDYETEYKVKIPRTPCFIAWVSNSAIQTPSKGYYIGAHLLGYNKSQETVNTSSLNTPIGGHKTIPSENRIESQTLY